MVMYTTSRRIYCLSSYKNSSNMSYSVNHVNTKFAINNKNCYHKQPFKELHHDCRYR